VCENGFSRIICCGGKKNKENSDFFLFYIVFFGSVDKNTSLISRYISFIHSYADDVIILATPPPSIHSCVVFLVAVFFFLFFSFHISSHENLQNFQKNREKYLRNDGVNTNVHVMKNQHTMLK
jgi:hypothetical protein